MNKYFIFIILLFATGCVAVEVSPKAGTTVVAKKPTAEPMTKMDYIFNGMTQKEVEAVLGDKLTIGYIRGQSDDKAFKEITINSPYKQEELAIQSGKYDVLYYYTHVVRADDIIAEDEMTPLVFEDGKLIGKGWDFLFRLKGSEHNP